METPRRGVSTRRTTHFSSITVPHLNPGVGDSPEIASDGDGVSTERKYVRARGEESGLKALKRVVL